LVTNHCVYNNMNLKNNIKILFQLKRDHVLEPQVERRILENSRTGRWPKTVISKVRRRPEYRFGSAGK